MKISKQKILIGELQLVVGGIFIGLGFVWDREAMLNGIGPLTFNATRYVVSVAFLGIISPLFSYIFESNSDLAVKEQQRNSVAQTESDCNKTYWINLLTWGMLAGVTAFFGATLEVVGLMTISANISGFILGLNIIVLPVLEWILMSTKFSWYVISAVIMSFIGLFIL